jgi:hypothetical protein
MKTPNSKLQAPKKFQAPKAQRAATWNLKVGIWSFVGFWDLEFGVFPS